MKDARGHGSNRKNLSVPDQHQHRILKDNLKNPLKAQFLGGPSVEESESILRSKFGYSDAEISNLKGGPSNKAAASSLASGPKSEPAQTHDSMDRVYQTGPALTPEVKAFVARQEANGFPGYKKRRP